MFVDGNSRGQNFMPEGKDQMKGTGGRSDEDRGRKSVVGEGGKNESRVSTSACSLGVGTTKRKKGRYPLEAVSRKSPQVRGETRRSTQAVLRIVVSEHPRFTAGSERSVGLRRVRTVAKDDTYPDEPKKLMVDEELDRVDV